MPTADHRRATPREMSVMAVIWMAKEGYSRRAIQVRYAPEAALRCLRMLPQPRDELLEFHPRHLQRTIAFVSWPLPSFERN